MGRKRKNNQSLEQTTSHNDLVFNESSEVTDLEVSGDTVEEVIEKVDYSEGIEKPKEKPVNRYSEMLKERAEQRMKWKSQN